MAAASQKRVSCLKFEPWSQIFLVKVAYQATFTHTTMKSHLLLKVLKVVRKQWDFSNSSKGRQQLSCSDPKKLDFFETT